MASVKTQFITLFGKQYKVRCPAGQETVLKQTEDLLNYQLLETKKSSGLTNREDIIMMTALNLCRNAVEVQIKQEADQKFLANSQASTMVNHSAPSAEHTLSPDNTLSSENSPLPENNSSRDNQPLLKPRTQGSAIAEAASKASQILKEKRP